MAIVDEEELLGRVVKTGQFGLFAVLLDPALVSLEALADSAVVGLIREIASAADLSSSKVALGQAYRYSRLVFELRSAEN